MPLITTPGSATADSYASLAAALTYHAAMGNAAWAASTDALREPALRRATLWTDATYRSRWTGYRLNGRTQSLDWPRSGVVDWEGYAVDSATIPAEVVSATCEAALRELATPGSLAPDYVASEQVASAAAGPVSVTFRDGSGSATVQPILTIVDGILARLLGARSRGIVELVRA